MGEHDRLEGSHAHIPIELMESEHKCIWKVLFLVYSPHQHFIPMCLTLLATCRIPSYPFGNKSTHHFLQLHHVCATYRYTLWLMQHGMGRLGLHPCGWHIRN